MTDENNSPQPADEPVTGAAAAPQPTAEHSPSDAREASEPASPAFDATDAFGGTDTSDDADVTFDSVAEAFAALTDGPDAVDQGAPPQYGVGPFSIREVALGAIWAVAFIVSFFSIYSVGTTASVWTGGIDWVLTIGVPTVAVFLVGLRRLSPQGIRRVGSLGVDQFASVAFSVSTVIWLGILWSSFVSLAGQRLFYATWVVWVEFILMLAGVFLTVFAPLFPTISEDFRHRTEVPAHRFASPARPVIARPVTERPEPVVASAAAADASPSSTADTGAYEYVDPAVTAATTTVEPVAAPASQAFWALAPVEREVVDESGAPLFTIGPSAWALVLEDRGTSFVVRHEDGRIGYLTDVSGVTRG